MSNIIIVPLEIYQPDTCTHKHTYLTSYAIIQSHRVFVCDLRTESCAGSEVQPVALSGNSPVRWSRGISVLIDPYRQFITGIAMLFPA